MIYISIIHMCPIYNQESLKYSRVVFPYFDTKINEDW